MTTLTVPATTNFAAQALNNIDLIDFTNLLDEATASFSAGQFDNAAILDTVAIDGNDLVNKIEVRGGSVDASLWQFTNWGGAGDTVTLKGSSGADTITGSSQADIIRGGDGADTIDGGTGADVITGGAGADDLRGGSQNDTFVYNDAVDAGSGEAIDGGSGGGDKIVLEPSISSITFTSATISNVEVLEYRGDVYALFDGEVFGGDGISQVIADPGLGTLYVEGSAVDLSEVEFTGWEAANPDDQVLIAGSELADTLTGSSLADQFSCLDGNDTANGGIGGDVFIPGMGVDTVIGRSGDDTIVFTAPDEIDDGDSLNGGGGEGDMLRLNDSSNNISYNISGLTLIGIERLSVADVFPASGLVTVFLSQSQIGEDAIGQVTLESASRLKIVGDAIDLSLVTFDGAAIADSSADLIGTVGSDTLIGGLLNDIIDGGGSSDIMAGNEGDDTFLIRSETDIVIGESIDGGADTDTIELSEIILVSVDLSAASIVAVERLAMLGSGQKATLSTEQIAALTEVEGSSGKQTLAVTADAIDLSALSFTAWGGSDIVKLKGTSGADNIIGSVEIDVISGLDGDDVIDGGAGNDRITGGLGRDELTGGSGADRFIYESLDDTPTGTTRDRIQDFTQGEDILVINVAGFTFIEDNAFSASGAAEINYEVGTSATTINLDGDGDGIAEAKIVLTGVIELSNADLVLL